MVKMNWSAIAAIFLAAAVGLGAFGAHGLRSRLDVYSMSLWEKAVFYHFIHGLGMLIASLVPRISAMSGWACWTMAAGILIFSGSLYLLAVTGVRTLGAITPIGGLCFIAGWLLLAWHFVSTGGKV
jgi:uncharacterized membrane protein YgdD (TMEM256/DUF423 family)